MRVSFTRAERWESQFASHVASSWFVGISNEIPKQWYENRWSRKIGMRGIKVFKIRDRTKGLDFRCQATLKSVELLTYVLIYLLTNSIEQSPSWEADRFSASQEISCIL
jgi:hypothetical protein